MIIYVLSGDNEVGSTNVLGVYSSLRKAEEARDVALTFTRGTGGNKTYYPDELYIDEYPVDELPEA